MRAAYLLLTKRFTAIVSLLCLISLAQPAYAAKLAKPKLKLPKHTKTSSGFADYPHSLHSNQANNGYFNTNFKLSFPVLTYRKSEISIYFNGYYNADTYYTTWQNRNTLSIGVSYTNVISDSFRIVASIYYDWDTLIKTAQKQEGFRADVLYFYYKNYWRNLPNNQTGWFRQDSWIKAWGKLTYPENLTPDNKNYAFTTSIEFAVAFVRPNSKLQHVPYIDILVAKDKYKLLDNNKVIAGFGFKLRYPIKRGEIIFGTKYIIDHRWTTGQTKLGPTFFVSWYRSF